MAHMLLWQQAGNYPAAADRALFGALWPSGGVLGGAVTAVNNTMTVSVAAGSAAVPLQDGTAALCRWDTAEAPPALAAAPGAGTSRIDLVIVQVRDHDLDGGANNDFILAIVQGTAAATPAAPAVPVNALALARVTVPAQVANLNTATLVDMRWSLIGGPYTAAYCNAAYVNANSSYQKLGLTAVEEGGGFWDVANKQFVVPVPGRYLITAEAQPDRALGFAYLQIWKNGGTLRSGPNANQPTTGTFANSSAGIASVVRAAAGDRLEVGSVTGGACNILAGANLTYAQFSYLGA